MKIVLNMNLIISIKVNCTLQQLEKYTLLYTGLKENPVNYE
jgi:hypothetical protein